MLMISGSRYLSRPYFILLVATACSWPISDDDRRDIATRILLANIDTISAYYRAAAVDDDSQYLRVIFLHPIDQRRLLPSGDVAEVASRRLTPPFVAIRADSSSLVVRSDSSYTPDGTLIISLHSRDRDTGLPIWEVAIDSVRATGPGRSTAVLMDWDWFHSNFVQTKWELTKKSGEWLVSSSYVTASN